ncbi:MAG TPA: Nudix family hydrolase [Rhodocyclaceae bacterium]|nr:Nudix family hydrolase [Rhodocyclaceae bacterium]
MVKRVAVSAAVITRPDGSFLLGQRAEGTFYPGYWEFPGGKVEAGETPHDAVVRELAEELGIAVQKAYPWLTREHRYEHAHVKLNFFEIAQWSGDVKDHVHSALAWQFADRLDVGPMLPANGPILKALRLPRLMAITHATEIGIAAQLKALEASLAEGLKLVQIREPELSGAALEAFAREVVARCRDTSSMVVINRDRALAERLNADGIHLSSAQLAETTSRPALEWVGASCHTRAELERAAELGMDYAVLGPVTKTTSHAGQEGIGWSTFAELARDLPVPVLAIGGLSAADMHAARMAGAHGVAAIRGAWL